MRNVGERIHGPYRRERKGRVVWRVVIVGQRREDSGHRGRVTHTCPSEEEALALISTLRAKSGARTVGKTVEEYLLYLKAKGNRERSIDTTRDRLSGLLKPLWGLPLAEVTPHRAMATYQTYAADRSPDTHRNALNQARSYRRWCNKQGWVKTNPWAEVEPMGRRSAGKPQLEPDEARRFARLCLDRALFDDGAAAALLCLYLGLRAGEVVGLEKRALNLETGLLSVRVSKTRAGVRRLEIPAVLVPALKARIERPVIFPYRREWVRDSVQRLCLVAGVPVVCAHGLRGTHATLATAAGLTPKMVAGSLGHESDQVTRTNYIAPGTIERAHNRSIEQRLDSGNSVGKVVPRCGVGPKSRARSET